MTLRRQQRVALANERRQTAAQEKVLADDADELRQAAAWEKALADKANEQQPAAAREKALADEANKLTTSHRPNPVAWNR